MPKAPKRKGKLASALAGQQLAQQQRQAEERARQAQEDRDKAKALKAANASRTKPTLAAAATTAGGGRASSALTDAAISNKGKKRARQDDQDDEENDRPRQDGGVQPFKKGERVLLVGEGNFSFAHALLGPSASDKDETEPSSSSTAANARQPLVTPSLLLCTAFDSEPIAAQKYPDLARHVEALRSAGATVLFGIDATNLAVSKQVREFAGFGPTGQVRGTKKKERRRVRGKGRMLEGWASRADKLEKDARMLEDGDEYSDEDRQVGFDKIVFNFPHVGQGITDQARNVRANQTLLLDFYRSAAPFLRIGKSHSSSSSSASARHSKTRDTGSDSEGDLDSALDEQAGPDAESGFLGDASMQAGIPTLAAAATGPLPPHRGTILMTLRTNGPYAAWLPAQLATKPSLLLPSIYPVHELKLRSTPQRGGPQPPYRTVRSWKFDIKRWEGLGYEHRRTVGYEEKFAELDGGKNADLAMTAKERKQRRLEAVAAAAATGGDKGAAAGSGLSAASQQHDIRTWEFELVADDDASSSTKRGGGGAAAGLSSASRGGKKGRAGGKGRKFEVGGADDPDLMSD